MLHAPRELLICLAREQGLPVCFGQFSDRCFIVLNRYWLWYALVYLTGTIYPCAGAHHPSFLAGLHYDPNVPVSFGFLFIALISSAVAVALMDYKITKAWGACLVGLYLAAMATSILVESSMVHL